MSRSRTAMATALLFVLACGGADDAASADMMSSAEQMAAAAAAMTPITTPIALTERDMQNFVAVIKDMQALGEEYRGKTGGAAIGQMGVGLAANAEAMAILQRHDFKDAIAFQRVAFSVGSAMAAAEMEGRTAEMEAARAKMEQMKASMSAEQYEAIMKSQEMAMGMVTDQPPGNVALVSAWKSRIEAASESK